MALLTCPECQGQVSSAAAACIHCGYPLGPATEAAESPPPIDEEAKAQAISMLRAERAVPSGTARIFAGVFGSILALATLVGSSAADSEGAIIVLVSALGIALALGLYWSVRGRRGYPLRWYLTVPLGAAGSIILLVIVVAMLNPGDPEAMGFAVGAGISYGLLLGTATSFLLYGLSGSTPR